MKNGKRILKVVIKHTGDDSPDTSDYGEYSNKRTSPYSIDREHSLDCAVNTPHAEAIALLDRVEKRIENDGTVPVAEHSLATAEAWSDALDLVRELRDTLAECDCDGHGDRLRNEYRYFNPSDNYKGETEENVRKYIRQDYERMEKLYKGYWWYFGVTAEATVILVPGEGIGQTITSGGVWGLESDVSAADLKEVEENELAELRAQLKAVGFSSRAISAAFKKTQHVDA